jgi:hypothetical protein
VEKLAHEVKKKCNEEWWVHMHALLKRFKLAITCPGGIPDHSGKYGTAQPTTKTYPKTKKPRPPPVTSYGHRNFE